MKKRTNKESKPFFQDGVYKKIENGYIQVLCGRTWVREHVLVVENFIGRKLKAGETIHHIDHNKKNNDISNLMIFKNQKEHKSFENKCKQFGITNNIKKILEERWKEYGK